MPLTMAKAGETVTIQKITGKDEVRLHQRFEKLMVDDLAGTECFPCINEVILTKLMTEISDHIIDVDTITSTVEKRRTCAWYG